MRINSFVRFFIFSILTKFNIPFHISCSPLHILNSTISSSLSELIWTSSDSVLSWCFSYAQHQHHPHHFELSWSHYHVHHFQVVYLFLPPSLILFMVKQNRAEKIRAKKFWSKKLDPKMWKVLVKKNLAQNNRGKKEFWSVKMFGPKKDICPRLHKLFHLSIIIIRSNWCFKQICM